MTRFPFLATGQWAGTALLCLNFTQQKTRFRGFNATGVRAPIRTNRYANYIRTFEICHPR